MIEQRLPSASVRLDFDHSHESLLACGQAALRVAKKLGLAVAFWHTGQTIRIQPWQTIEDVQAQMTDLEEQAHATTATPAKSRRASEHPV